MDFDVLAAAAAAVHMPWTPTPPPVREAAPPDGKFASIDPAHRAIHTPVTPAPPPRRVELSFHEDLRVLITKVIDEQTGETVVQTPARQVLDMVADVMRQIHTTEEG